jgi:hypothetical protein
MKALDIELGTLKLPCAFVALVLMVCNDGTAQIQQAWLARYNNGITNGTNQAVKMALDSGGNIYVTGVSQNSLTNLGYVTIKYAPNGAQLWASRYDSTNYPSAAPAALGLDSSNDVFVTGTALTIKYDPNGNQLWTAPYSGTSLAADANGNSYVTGFSTAFNTVKLSPLGSNQWMTTYVDVGPTISQIVLVDNSSNVYVIGSDTYLCIPGQCYVQLLIVKYDSNGNQLWMANYAVGDNFSVQVENTALDPANNLYMVSSFSDQLIYILKYTINGSLVWEANPSDNGNSRFPGLALDAQTNVLVTGMGEYNSPTLFYETSKLSNDGVILWTSNYPLNGSGVSAASSIAVDSVGNSYVTGYSPGTNSINDIVTIKYGVHGNPIWLQRYNGPGNGNAAGNAIAVDNDGRPPARTTVHQPAPFACHP